MEKLAELKFRSAHDQAQGVEDVDVVQFALGIEISAEGALMFGLQFALNEHNLPLKGKLRSKKSCNFPE